jgi:hypothetical protein
VNLQIHLKSTPALRNPKELLRRDDPGWSRGKPAQDVEVMQVFSFSGVAARDTARAGAQHFANWQMGLLL